MPGHRDLTPEKRTPRRPPPSSPPSIMRVTAPYRSGGPLQCNDPRQQGTLFSSSREKRSALSQLSKPKRINGASSRVGNTRNIEGPAQQDDLDKENMFQVVNPSRTTEKGNRVAPKGSNTTHVSGSHASSTFDDRPHILPDAQLSSDKPQQRTTLRKPQGDPDATLEPADGQQNSPRRLAQLAGTQKRSTLTDKSRHIEKKILIAVENGSQKPLASETIFEERDKIGGKENETPWLKSTDNAIDQVRKGHEAAHHREPPDTSKLIEKISSNPSSEEKRSDVHSLENLDEQSSRDSPAKNSLLFDESGTLSGTNDVRWETNESPLDLTVSRRSSSMTMYSTSTHSTYVASNTTSSRHKSQLRTSPAAQPYQRLDDSLFLGLDIDKENADGANCDGFFGEGPYVSIASLSSTSAVESICQKNGTTQPIDGALESCAEHAFEEKENAKKCLLPPEPWLKRRWRRLKEEASKMKSDASDIQGKIHDFITSGGVCRASSEAARCDSGCTQ